MIPDGDTRLTERRKQKRIYICDLCGTKKVFKGKAQLFDGAFAVFQGLKSIGLKDFSEMKIAWEEGFDFTWYCNDCHNRRGTMEKSRAHVIDNIQYRALRSISWSEGWRNSEKQ